MSSRISEADFKGPKDEHIYADNSCSRCKGGDIGDNGSGEYVCYGCGLVLGPLFEGQITCAFTLVKTYKRIFYFNERCSRWSCTEPAISQDIWEVIHATAREKRFSKLPMRRDTVGQILRSVKLPGKILKKHRSKKYKKNPLTPKRFYDKYFEKWKTIIGKITGKPQPVPDPSLVRCIKHLFVGCQVPFELYRHVPECDGRQDCDKYYKCWHNFCNYDFTFRKLLQIAEIKFGYKGCYAKWKDEFPLVSLKVRVKKLRPMFFKIANYNGWPCINDE
jgi:hypothetical protein